MTLHETRGLKSLLAINFLSGSASGILLLALPLYTMSLNAGAAEMGLISGMAGVGRMLIIVPSGLWVDRNGTRRLFVASTVMCGFLTFAIPLVRDSWLLMIIMFFQGMAQSVGFMTLQAGFLRRMQHMSASMAGWQRSSTQLGFFLVGPLAGGYLLAGNRFFPAFLVTGALFLSGVAIVLYRRCTGINEAVENMPPEPGNDFRRLLLLLKNPDLGFVLAIELLGAAIFMIFRTFMAPVALDVLKLPVHKISWLVITQGIMAMCSLFFGKRIIGNLAEGKRIVVAAMLVVSGNVLLATAAGFVSFWLGALIYGAGTGLLSYCSLTRLMQVEGEKGKIAALFSLSVAVGNIVGPVAGGFTGELLGLQALFFTPAVLLLPALCFIFLTERRQFFIKIQNL